MPSRIQRQRTPGWRMPANAVYVGRGSIWATPFVPGMPSGCDFQDGGDPTPIIASLSKDDALRFYRDMLQGFLCPEMHPHGHRWIDNFRTKIKGCSPISWARSVLRGKDLADWGAPNEPTHVDVLLELANQ